MTVRAIVPFIEYTGNGSITGFDWDWDMVEDSSINVLLNNENVFAWTLQDQTVVFDTAPADGDEIIIYRRTIINQPENYQPFGRFHSEKTELTMDRNMLIAQEVFGDIVGGGNLSITRGEYTVTVVSECGTDAIIPMYDPDGIPIVPPGLPDENILWGQFYKDTLYVGRYSLPANVEGITTLLRFKMNLDGGESNEASAYYHDYNAFKYTGWWKGTAFVPSTTHFTFKDESDTSYKVPLTFLDADDTSYTIPKTFLGANDVSYSLDPAYTGPGDDDYWMRVRVQDDDTHLIIHDGEGVRADSEPFLMRTATPVPLGTLVDRDGNIIVDRTGVYVLPADSTYEAGGDGPYIALHTFGDTAPVTRNASFYVDISKDSGGVSDGKWYTRLVEMEAIFNTVVVVVPDPTIAIWEGVELYARDVAASPSTQSIAQLHFYLDIVTSPDTKPTARYQNYSSSTNFTDHAIPWCTIDPVEGDYWMRVTQDGTSLPTTKYKIYDGQNYRVSGEQFQMLNWTGSTLLGPFITVGTWGEAAPASRIGRFKVEICKDSGGSPDGNWATRYATLEAVYSAGISTVGSVTWESVFGVPLDYVNGGSYNTPYGYTIPTAGISIRFQAPQTTGRFFVSFNSSETTSISTTRTGAINQGVLDFTTPPTKGWGIGGGLWAGVNYVGTDLEMVPGETYFFNIRNNSPRTSGNYIVFQAQVFAEE